MLSSSVQVLIPKIQMYFAKQPIARAWLFGSCSRGEETPESDIDILVQYKAGEQISLFTISRMVGALQKILNKQVDLVEDGQVLPFAYRSVYRDRILIYEG